MHIHIILILFAIPSLLLAEKCPRPFENPRTKKIETTWFCCRGYSLGSGGKCNPICNTNCENGVCIMPNQCQCNAGYQNMNNDPSKGCAPVCDGCENGYCVAPRVCEKCSKGFTIRNNTCYSGEDKSEMTADKLVNVWKVGTFIIILVVVVLAAFIIYRVLYRKHNTKSFSLEGYDNHVMVNK